MKSVKNKFLMAVAVLFIAGSSVATTAYAVDEPCGGESFAGDCGYKKKECLFYSDTKCNGSGRDCAISDPCGNSY